MFEDVNNFTNNDLTRMQLIKQKLLQSELLTNDYSNFENYDQFYYANENIVNNHVPNKTDAFLDFLQKPEQSKIPILIVKLNTCIDLLNKYQKSLNILNDTLFIDDILKYRLDYFNSLYWSIASPTFSGISNISITTTISNPVNTINLIGKTNYTITLLQSVLNIYSNNNYNSATIASDSHFFTNMIGKTLNIHNAYLSNNISPETTIQNFINNLKNTTPTNIKLDITYNILQGIIVIKFLSNI